MMNRTLTALSLLALGMSVGCSTKGTGSPESTGQLELAITSAPDDGTCIQVMVGGTRATERDVDVKPGQDTVLSLSGLPIGAVTVTVNAYAGKCEVLTANSTPTWVGDPVTTTLLSGVLGKLTALLHRNGRLALAVDFDNAASFFSPKCLECLNSRCQEPLKGGCESLVGSAAEGPATGVSKKQLCNETLGCVVSTKCGTSDLSTCYCGDVPGTACVDEGVGNGRCKLALERSYEAVQPLDVPVRFHDATFAGGVAMNLLACAFENCDVCP